MPRLHALLGLVVFLIAIPVRAQEAFPSSVGYLNQLSPARISLSTICTSVAAR